MPISDAYIMELQIEDLIYDQMDAQELEDCDLPDWFTEDDCETVPDEATGWN